VHKPSLRPSAMIIFTINPLVLGVGTWRRAGAACARPRERRLESPTPWDYHWKGLCVRTRRAPVTSPGAAGRVARASGWVWEERCSCADAFASRGGKPSARAWSPLLAVRVLGRSGGGWAFSKAAKDAGWFRQFFSLHVLSLAMDG